MKLPYLTVAEGGTPRGMQEYRPEKIVVVKLFGPRDAIAAALYGASLPTFSPFASNDIEALRKAHAGQDSKVWSRHDYVLETVNPEAIDPNWAFSGTYPDRSMKCGGVRTEQRPAIGQSSVEKVFDVSVTLSLKWRAGPSEGDRFGAAWSRRHHDVLICIIQGETLAFFKGGNRIRHATVERGDKAAARVQKGRAKDESVSLAMAAKRTAKVARITTETFHLAFKDYLRQPLGDLKDVLGDQFSQANLKGPDYLLPLAREWALRDKAPAEKQDKVSLIDATIMNELDLFGTRDSIGYISQHEKGVDLLARPKLDTKRLRHLSVLCMDHPDLARYVASDHGLTLNGEHAVAFMARTAAPGTPAALGVAKVLGHIREQLLSHPPGGGQDQSATSDRDHLMNALRASGNPDAWRLLIDCREDMAADARDVRLISELALRSPTDLQCFLEEFGSQPYTSLSVGMRSAVPRAMLQTISDFSAGESLQRHVDTALATPKPSPETVRRRMP